MAVAISGPLAISYSSLVVGEGVPGLTGLVFIFARQREREMLKLHDYKEDIAEKVYKSVLKWT